MEKIEQLYYRLTTENLEKRDYSRPFKDVGIRIENRMPSCFEGYAKIMHPWYLNADAPEKYFKEKTTEELFPDELDDYLFELYQTDKEKYDLYLIEHEEKMKPYKEDKIAYLKSIDPNAITNWKELNWKEVCQIYEVDYHNQLSLYSYDYKYKGQRYGLIPPNETVTPTKQSLQILNILQKHTKTEVLFNSSCKGLQSIPIADLSLKDICPAEGLWGTITTHKREWMTYTTHESVYTVIGGSYKLIDDLLSSDLEVMECNFLTRIDGYSDSINV